MAVTSIVDVSPLQQNFNLHVYDQLVQPDVYEAVLSVRSQQAATETASAGDGDDTMQQPETADQSVPQGLQSEDTAPNAFAMTMLCCEPESEQAASSALLAAAFDAFPDKDYCLLTLPPDSPEVALLGTFTRLLPPPGSALVHVLYLCHRFALLDQLQVQPGDRTQLEGVQALLIDTVDMVASMAAFTAGIEANSAFVVICESQVVGMAAIQPITDLSQLRHNFHTIQVAGLTEDDAADHRSVQLTAICLNPIFQHRARQVLLDVLKRCKARMMLFHLQPDRPAPEALGVFRQVAPRHTVLHTADNTEAGFALFVFYPELPGKTAVNSHVVVVGASDCGLSVIETLVLHERLQFSAVTLLAPRGLHAGASDAHYTAELLQRLGLHATVNILSAELVDINKEEHCVVLLDKRKLQYGLLLLAVGLDKNDALLQQQLKGSLNSISSQDLPASIPEDIADMDSIVVCGPAFEALTAMGQLEAAGGDMSRVQHCGLVEQGSSLSTLLRGAAPLAGVTLPETIQVTSIACGAAEDGRKAELTATLIDGATYSQAVDLVVVAGGQDRGRVPRCVENAGEVGGLVCDGRLVVDAAFRTNDPKIFAAGTVATFSRRYGSGLSHSLYNSREVGQRAADSIAASFSSPFLGDSALPKLTCGRVATTALPGGGRFMCASAAGTQRPGRLDSQGGRALVSSTQGGYLHITLDSNDCMQSLTFCTSGTQPSLTPTMLLLLAGLPITYLNDLLHAHESGELADLPEYLKQPWAGLLYQESFPQLRSSLIEELLGSGRPLQELDSNSVTVNSEGAIADVQAEVIDFVKQQGPADFPQYDVSVFVS
ncbi:hypothetical protein ABBQ38_001949 [Trebouxia sp. C0009 RCD-2024]